MSNERLQEIEDEVKLLKNEIKQTLLDIQEHLLTLPQAALGEPLPLAPAAEAAPSPQPQASPGSASEWDTEAEPGEAERAVTGRATPAREAGAPSPADLPSEPLPPPNGAALGPPIGHSGSTPDLRTVARLTQWVGATVSAIGQERMGAVLELYELLEQLPEPLGQALVGFATLEAGTGSCPREDERTPRSESLAALLELKNLLSGQPNGRHTTPFSPAWGTGSQGQETFHR